MTNVTRYGMFVVLCIASALMPAHAVNCYAKDEGVARTQCEASRAKISAKYTSSCDLNGAKTGWLCSGTGGGAGYSCDGLVQFFTDPKPMGVCGGHYFETTCAQRPTTFSRQDVTAGTKLCATGCEVTMNPTERTTFETAGRENIVTAKGEMTPTGNACGDPTPPVKPPKSQTCQETLAGHLVCRRDDGNTCITSGATGRTYCDPDGRGKNATNPNRTENASIGPKSPTPTPPTPPTPRPGENWKPNSSATITTNNITNSTTNSSSISMSTNTGTPNTNPGDGNPDDGSGDNGTPGKPGVPGNADGDGDGLKPNQVGGTGACGSTYSCTGGDQALCAILREQQQARCDSNKGAEPGQLDGLEGDMDTALGKLFGGTQEFDAMSILGNYLGATKACPPNPVIDMQRYGTLEIPLNRVCPYLQIFGVLALCAAYLYAIKIMITG